MAVCFSLCIKVNTECELDAVDQTGCTPLHHACINAPDGHRSVKVRLNFTVTLVLMPQAMSQGLKVIFLLILSLQYLTFHFHVVIKWQAIFKFTIILFFVP